MKLPDVLEQAILTTNWQLVSDVLFAVNGKRVLPPKPKSEAEELADLDIPNTIVEVEDDDEDDSVLPIRRAPMKKKRGRNSFVDDFSLATKDLTENDPQLVKMYKPVPSERRPETQLLELQCTQCHQTVQVPPSLASSRSFDPSNENDERALFRCDKCSKLGGGKK